MINIATFYDAWVNEDLETVMQLLFRGVSSDLKDGLRRMRFLIASAIGY